MSSRRLTTTKLSTKVIPLPPNGQFSLKFFLVSIHPPRLINFFSCSTCNADQERLFCQYCHNFLAPVARKVSWRAVKDGAAVFRDIVGCELRTSVKIWESINGGEAKPYGLRPPTGPPPSPATLDKGQRWRKEPCALLALSQHKTVGFQIFRFDRRFVHFFVFALKCEGCSVDALWSIVGWMIIWWAEQRAESSPDGEIGKIGFEMTTKNPQFPFSKRLKWRDGCRRFKLPDSSSRAWIYELFMILRPVEITLIYLQQFELCGSGKVGNFGHFKGHYLPDCL